MPRPELGDDWRCWIADNLLRGVEPARLVDLLVGRGLAVDDARAAVAAAEDHPYLRAARPLAEALRRRESLLDVQAALAELVLPPAIPRRPRIGRDEFLREHYAVQRPVILTDALNVGWSFEQLARRHGALEVEIQDGREREPGAYQREFGRFCRRIGLAALIERITSASSSNEFYLTAKNRLLDQPGARALLDDLPPLPEIFESPPEPGDVSIWLGPAGTRTPLHHDWMNAAVAQVCGRKRFHLIPAWHAGRVANHDSRFADVDCEAPDRSRHPRFAGARVYDVVLSPGELLFVPVGWWHQVRALEPSISVTLTGFVFANHYEWDTDMER
jgi:hypothetical protein